MTVSSHANNVEPLHSNVELTDNCPACAAACIGARKAHLLHSVALGEQIPRVFVISAVDYNSMGNPAVLPNAEVLPIPSTAFHHVHTEMCGVHAICLSRFLHCACKECGHWGNWNTHQEYTEKWECMSVLASCQFQTINFMYAKSTSVRWRFLFLCAQCNWHAKYSFCHFLVNRIEEEH